MSKSRDKRLSDIARNVLGLETLETRKMDSLDFHEVAVWAVKDALERAYEAGRSSAAATRTIAFEGVELDSKAEAVQHANADPKMNTAILLHGKYYAVAKSTAEHLETEGVAFAYLCDQEMPDGTWRITTVPVND